MSDPAVIITEVSKTYTAESGAPAHALDGVSLSVDQGEFVAIVGPTGCGKTTLLNLVAGLDSPTSGTVSRCAKVGSCGCVPCVFQHYTLFPWRTVIRNVTFGFEMRGVPRPRRSAAAEELLDQVGLAGTERSYPHELSGGMRQRAALAQALAAKPEILLMDEPFGALDDSTRRALQELITDVWRETGLTILFVTHSIEEAITLGDRVVLVSGRPGRVSADYRIDVPRPRDRLSTAYTELFVEIRRSLSTANSA